MKTTTARFRISLTDQPANWIIDVRDLVELNKETEEIPSMECGQREQV